VVTAHRGTRASKASSASSAVSPTLPAVTVEVVPWAKGRSTPAVAVVTVAVVADGVEDEDETMRESTQSAQRDPDDEIGSDDVGLVLQ